ncbi:hypothetical protein BCR39DRAFT_552470 [Naematelia encephala]|uniref:Threonine/serine exporter-like N-terminal domain-containing protein n=1 Tax=Naematelia encephala TaxID=71784 RepID=A0A1Y2AI75_9TREE|nr:hypothetical protein BCR39DRAFT_552470 [Naematelia encephala]
MAAPYPRPALKRQNSKVRFSRTDMSPVGTMASDSTVHGVHGQHSYRQNEQDQGYEEQEMYDGSEQPFTTEMDLSLSRDDPRDDGGYYQGVPQAQAEVKREYGDVPPVDGYTSTPPRVSARRWSNSPATQHRPTLETLISGNEVQSYHPLGDLVSPRTSSFGRAPEPYQNSPQPRPSSAFRPALVLPPNAPGSPHQAQAQHAIVERLDYPGSPQRNMRPSVPNIGTPPRTTYEQHRSSVPVFQSPQIGSPRHTPRGSPNPELLQQHRGSGFRRYDDYPGPDQRLSPVPPYQSPRQSQSYYTGDRGDYRERYYEKRDSEATLRGDDDEKGKGSPTRDRDRSYRRPRSMSDDSTRSRSGDMRRRTTREIEGDEDNSYHAKGGVFSQLLRLTGRGSTLRRRVSSRGPGAMSAASSAQGGDLPTMGSLGIKRSETTTSTVFGADELDPDDPRVTGQKKKKNRRNSWAELPFTRSSFSAGGNRRNRRASIQLHVADILTRQQFVLKLAKALMTFGAPSHRIESQLVATALVLEINAEFIHFPSIVIASFGDHDTRTSETHFVKAGGGLDLGKLHKVHHIYKDVVHDQLDAAEGTKRIHALLKAPMEYNLWQRMLIAFLCSGIICPLGFGGSLIDGLASGFLGILLSFLQLHVASKSAMYSNIFEISIATVISFTARGLSSTGLFCYQAVGSAGVVLILPGYTILCGSLELASKNIVSGSVRMVYAIIYSLFLGFGITIGSDLFYVVDPKARHASQASALAAQHSISLSGLFVPSDLIGSSIASINASTTFVPFNGTFTFSNATRDAVTSSLEQGSIICPRPPDWPWWRQGMPAIYLLLLVPTFSILLSLWNMQPLRSRELPVMVLISCIGFLTNTLANHYIFDRSDVVSAIGAFVIGILGNIYSRVFGGTAFTSMVTGVLFLVPSGIAAAGGLAMSGNSDHSTSYSQGLIIGFRMVQVAIGITVGLFGSGLLIYSFGRKKGAALFAF